MTDQQVKLTGSLSLFRIGRTVRCKKRIRTKMGAEVRSETTDDLRQTFASALYRIGPGLVENDLSKRLLIA